MTKIFEFVSGLMFLVAALLFLANPRKALEETYDVLVAPSPRIVGNSLVLRRANSHRPHRASQGDSER